MFHFHQSDADDDPDDLPYTADDAHEDAKGCREAQSSNGENKSSLLNAQLHGQETNEVGKEGRECHDEDAVKECQRQSVKTATAVDTKEQQHKHHRPATRQVKEQE